MKTQSKRLEMVDDTQPVRIRDFHGLCGARIFTGWALGEPEALYYASAELGAAEIRDCPCCGAALRCKEDVVSSGSELGSYRRPVTTVVTSFEMEQRCLAAQERMCAGEGIDGEAIVCMSSELEEGKTFEEIAPLYGRGAETLRGEIAAFMTHQPITIHAL